MKTKLEKGRPPVFISIDDMDKEQSSRLAGTYCAKRIEILKSANKNYDRLVHIGETCKKTQVSITKEAVEADHIIIFGSILHHMAAGFGGGRKYLLPGIAGYDTIHQSPFQCSQHCQGRRRYSLCCRMFKGCGKSKQLTFIKGLFLL
ncbi:MAG: DUF2088 domain-containing protein [Deltaproteobacteria bacterium]|nr:DUF2088 domain-containing protein [Deltaproteobacteria bacterium]